MRIGLGPDSGSLQVPAAGAQGGGAIVLPNDRGGQVLNIFGTDDTTLLGTVDITQTSNQAADGAVETMISSATLGGLIGSIEVDLPGPAANPPYVLAIDTFSASADIPEPASAIAILGLSSLMLWRRRQTRMG